MHLHLRYSNKTVIYQIDEGRVYYSYLNVSLYTCIIITVPEYATAEDSHMDPVTISFLPDQTPHEE